MKETYSFLQELAQNNNREWFNANKPHFKELQERFHAFAQQLIDAVSAWDEEIAASNLTVKDCTYRIYRDRSRTRPTWEFSSAAEVRNPRMQGIISIWSLNFLFPTGPRYQWENVSS